MKIQFRVQRVEIIRRIKFSEPLVVVTVEPTRHYEYEQAHAAMLILANGVLYNAERRFQIICEPEAEF